MTGVAGREPAARVAAGSRVVVVDAQGGAHRATARSGPVPSRDTPVVWVEFVGAEGSTPWPAGSVRPDEFGECDLTPGCEHGRHEASEHPCGRSVEPPGTPCRHCGGPVPEDGTACPDCWEPLAGKSLAELKGIFAETDLGLDVPDGEGRL